MKPLWLLTTSIAAALSLSSAPTIGRDRLHTFQQENVLGTSFELKVLAAILTCVGGTKTRRAQARPVSDERDGTSYAPLDHEGPSGHDLRWDEEPAPGAGPRRGRQEAL